MATANGSAAGSTPAQRDLQSIPLRGHTVYVWRQPEPTKHAFAWRVVMDTDQREEVAAGEADTAADAWDAALAQVPDADRADFTEEQGEALFSQVMACEPLLAEEDVDRFLNAMYGPDARRKLRAIAAFATKGGAFFKEVSEDRSKAVAAAMITALAEDDIKLFRGVVELIEGLQTRALVALCNHEAMDAIKAEAEAILAGDEMEAEHG